MKKFVIYLLILNSLVFISCKDMLDLKPQSSLGFNSFWINEDGVKAAQVALHANFRDFDQKLWALGELRSDIWGGVSLESPSISNMQVIGQDISVDKVPDYSVNWSGFYTFIYLVNDIIKNAPNITFQKKSERDYILGQAYGVRAFIYYTMLKTWGDVPLVLEPIEKIDFENLYIARTPAVQIMNQIKNDIQSSLDKFADDNSFLKNNRDYWSKAATLTLKADVFIWSGTQMEGGNADYTIAKQALQAVIDMGNFQLLSNFSDVFSYSNKNNKEIIFAFSFAIDQATNWYYGNFTARKSDIAILYLRNGQPTTSLIVNGGNLLGPSNELLTKWIDFDDTRNDATFYRLYSNPNATGYKTSMLRKFWGTISAGVMVGADDIPVYRYADVILLMAEAKNLLGEDPSAEINQIRKRAYGSKFPGHEYTNGTKEKNIESILDERLFEFIGEGKRWFDLRRSGNNWVFKFNKFLNPAIDTYLLLLPITREMMGRNVLLTQTPGYTN